MNTLALLVRDIMVHDPVTVTPQMSIDAAAQLMADRNIGALAVTADRRVVGMFTERDLVRRAAALRKDWERIPVAQCMTSNPITVGPDIPWPEAMSLMDERGIRHLPVIENEQLVGMLSVRDLVHHRARYLETLVRERTTELADRNSALTARDRQITRNLKVAARIQKRLLPESLPIFPPFRFAAAVHPYDQVNGDYYDFLPLDADRLGILIADASGHGVPAAFVSVMTKMCCTAYCQGLTSPSAILSTLNQQLGDLMEAEHFVTMFAAVVDRRTLEIVFARAGHPLPLLYRAATGQVLALDAPGPMIGVTPEPEYRDDRHVLEPGDKILFYTDGVPDCRCPSGELFGFGSLKSFLSRDGRQPCADLLASLERELVTFGDSRPFDDDATSIIMEVLAPGE